MNKTIKALALCAVLLVTSAFAQSTYDKKDGCPQVPSGPHAFCYPKDVGLSCPQDFYLFGEFLMFQAEEQGLDFCVKNNVAPAGGFVLPLRGGNVEGFSTGSHDWDWNFGGRFGFGFYLNHDNWNLEAKWTYLHIKEDRTVSATNGQTLVPFFVPPAMTSANSQFASARWKTKFNAIDLDLGKPYFVSRYFILHPFMGAKALWIDQDYVARYSGTWNTEEGLKMTAKNDRWGVGLRGGLQSEWMLGAGWLLYGNFAGSIVYGKYDVSQELPAGAHSYEIDQDFYAVNPNLELRLGVLWTHHYCENKYRLALGGAYEFHYFWDENQLKRFFGDSNFIASNDTVSRGDFSLNGLSFKAQFDF